MGKRSAALLLVCVILLSMLAACEGPLASVLSTDGPTASSERTGAMATSMGGASATDAETENNEQAESPGDGSATDPAVESDGRAEATGTDSPTETVVEPSDDHEDAADPAWDSSEATRIILDGRSGTVDGGGATIARSTVTISSGGTYSIHGSLSDGQIVVDAEDQDVRLVLDGVDIRSSTNAAIHIKRAQEVLIVLAENTENHISDGDSRPLGTTEEDEPNAAVFSMADLAIAGNGSLIVDGNYRDGIASKDGLVVAGGTLTVSSVDDGIRGKDYLVVQDGTITVSASGDGLKSDNETDTAMGYVHIQDGKLDITAGADAIQAQTGVVITDGELTLSSGGGSDSWIDESASAKGIKGVASVKIDGGTFAISSADDAIHSNGSIEINAGSFVLSTGDDGMHADSTLAVNGGDIRITDSYEGLESAAITINGGEVRVASSDDGINVASGNDASGFMPGPGRGGHQGSRQGGGPGPGGWPGQDAFSLSGDNYLHINGGYISVDADGDGFDVNGPIEMTDGVVLISGPTERMNGALDYLGEFNISGGFLVAAGSAGMAMAPSESSDQYSLLLSFNGTVRAGALIHIQTTDGKEILTFSPAKQYETAAFSSAELERGADYEVYLGGSSTGSVSDGLYQGGTYTPGTQYTSFTLTGPVTWIGGSFR